MKHIALSAATLLASVAAAFSSGLEFHQPAEDSLRGWEQESFPLGNGWFGINGFGSVTNDRFQVTQNSVLTIDFRAYHNLTDALEIRLETEHHGYQKYERELDFEEGVAETEYMWNGVRYKREYFTSYPAKVMALRLTASRKGALDFKLAAVAPFLHPYGTKCGSGVVGRTAKYTVTPREIDVYQELEAFALRFDSKIRLVTDGIVTTNTYRSIETDGPTQAVPSRKEYFPTREVTTPALQVKGATEAVIYFACDTNYRLTPEVFLREPDNRKLDPIDPTPDVKALVDAAERKGYAALKREHEADFGGLMKRVELDLGDDDEAKHIANYFQFGRYLLVSSSRPGTLPPNLQGVWNAHQFSPWGSGYWHNINIQMNYWPTFSCNLAECFESYAAFNAAFRPAAARSAANYVRQVCPENSLKTDESSDWWCVGTGIRPYRVEGPGGHSGPGTGGLTTKLFKDWWDFTYNHRALTTYIWPTIHGMADFLSRCVVETNGLYLSKFSASPEQIDAPNGQWDWRKGPPPYYVTTGCAFDQQMIWENNHDLLELAKVLKIEDSVVRRVREQIDHYDPVQVGESGQIKEFREERKYGEIGEYTHRHISQLVGLYPGSLITADTPDWLEAARYSLTERGDKSTGWALAHRICCWARLRDGDHAKRLIDYLLAERTHANLWDVHPPFQIDGNFGATAGIAEMLLQSHAGYIDLLPALPKAWSKEGEFKGLCARGACEVDCEWKNGRPTKVVVRPHAGTVPEVRFAGQKFPAKIVR